MVLKPTIYGKRNKTTGNIKADPKQDIKTATARTLKVFKATLNLYEGLS
jgi:hypothetical protein